MLDKPNFWDVVEKDSPLAMKKFHSYIDDFKSSINWDDLFGRHLLYSKEDFPYTGTYHEAPKFHHLPYLLQKGIVDGFLWTENINYSILKNPFNEKLWTFNVHDTVEHKSWTLFTDQTQKELAPFPTPEEAEIGAIRIAFQTINTNFLKNLN